MASVEDFIQSPSEEGLGSFTKAQLGQVAEHNKITLTEQNLRRKESIRSALVTGLVEAGVFTSIKGAADPISTAGLSFDQKKELMLLQFQQEQLRLELRSREARAERDD